MRLSVGVPFRISRDVATASGAALERAKVEHILLTEPGELPWRTAFGAALDALRHRPLDAVQAELVRVRSEEALATWLPGTEVQVESLPAGDAALQLRVTLTGGETQEVTR